MKVLYPIFITLLFSTSLFSADIYVSAGDQNNSPYYNFYGDAAGTVSLDIESGGSGALTIGETYTFQRLSNASSHPFYVNGDNITVTGAGSASFGIILGQTFDVTIDESFDPATDSINFVCTAHPSMTGTFNVSATASDPTFASDTENFAVAAAGAQAKGFYRVLTTTSKAEGILSHQAQEVVINVTSLPAGVNHYRTLKQNAGGNWIITPSSGGTPLNLGMNTITVGAVSFDRKVTVHFGQADVAFDYLRVNGVVLHDSSLVSTPISTVFEANADSNHPWPYSYQSVQYSDGAASLNQQVFKFDIPSLPVGGANYQIYKTLAENSDDTDLSAAVALQEGINIITVGQAGWDPTISGNTTGRNVKIRLSTDVDVMGFAVNGTYIIGADPNPVTVPEGSVLASSEFTTTSEANWQQAYTLTTAEVGGVANPSSKSEQVISFNVTSLGPNGADYRTYRTLAGTNSEGIVSTDTTNAVQVKLGPNSITVPAATGTAWDDPSAQPGRTVKLQLSSDIAIDKLVVNGSYIVGADSSNMVAPTDSVLASSVSDSSGQAWPYWHTIITTDGDIDGFTESKEEQVISFYVTEIPTGGSFVRVVKTLANLNAQGEPNTNISGLSSISLGMNTFTVPAVDWDDNPSAQPGRTVQIELTDDVAINQLTINGTDIVAPPAPPAGSSFVRDVIDPTTNVNTAVTWPHVYTASLKSDLDPTSLNAHTFVINVTELPDGGADYEIYRTTFNPEGVAGEYTSGARSLSLGLNRFTVPAVPDTWDTVAEPSRTVKIRFSSPYVALEYFGHSLATPSVDISGSPVDTDSDGTDDLYDAFPSDASESADADGDGIGANADLDDNDANVGSTPLAAPALSISSDGSNLTLSWEDTAGFEVKSSTDLSTWSSTGDTDGSFSESLGTSKFYKLSND